MAGTILPVPDLRPFRGLRYAAPAVTDYSAVICPALRRHFAGRAGGARRAPPGDAVHVELPATYDEAHRVFEAWQADGTLRRDERALLYVYEQLTASSTAGRGRRAEPCAACASSRRRRVVRVRAHEHTMSAPKEDRFRLLAAVRANLQPGLLLYQAGADFPAGDLPAALTAAPTYPAVDDAGIEHRLWLVDPATSSSAATSLQASRACR